MSRSRKRPYTGSKRFDRTCRNHGSCPWCRGNRLCSLHRGEDAAKHQLDEFYDKLTTDDDDTP